MTRCFGLCQSSNVYMCKTRDADTTQHVLSFADPVAQNRRRRHYDAQESDYDDDGQMCSIWSARFSADGKEVVAGGNGKIFGS